MIGRAFLWSEQPIGEDPMSRRRNPWIKLGWDSMALGAEAASVIGLRSLKLTAGGAAAEREAALMVSEKVQAAWALQGLAMAGALGFTAPRMASKTLAHYRRKVRANRRRLLKRRA
jgi:hypothetical protein